VLLLLAAACATSSGKGGKEAAPQACERGLCAKIVEHETPYRIVVELTAPPNASLHNAYVAEPGVAACRGGRALHSVGSDAGTKVHGPSPLPSSARLTLMFDVAFTSGTGLDLDVRSPDGMICLRVPFATTVTDAGAPAPEGGRG